MRRTANFSWIWAVGCAAWTVDAVVSLRYPNKQHAEVAFLLAVMFGIAWGFYRQQRRR
jgi:hypothetical protein